MDVVVSSATFSGSTEAFIGFCRSLDSRQCWPGAALSMATPDALYYMVSMRLKSATMTDIDIEERIGPLEQTPQGVRFGTTQRCTWPDGVALGETEYLFEGNSLTFTYRYEPPTTKLVKTKDLPKFHDGMEHVATRYLAGLTSAFVPR